MDTKFCKDCGQTKPLDDFYKNRTQAQGRQAYCKPCWRLRSQATYKRINYRHHRTSRLRKLYGITMDDYDQLLAAQGGGCAICGGADEGRNLAVDHCHDNSKVRGLLCRACNQGLGQFRDRPDLLNKAAQYLAQ